MTSLVSCCARIVNQNKWPTLLYDRAFIWLTACQNWFSVEVSGSYFGRSDNGVRMWSWTSSSSWAFCCGQTASDSTSQQCRYRACVLHAEEDTDRLQRQLKWPNHTVFSLLQYNSVTSINLIQMWSKQQRRLVPPTWTSVPVPSRLMLKYFYICINFVT
jgi:hypothetical protein